MCAWRKEIRGEWNKESSGTILFLFLSCNHSTPSRVHVHVLLINGMADSSYNNFQHETNGNNSLPLSGIYSAIVFNEVLHPQIRLSKLTEKRNGWISRTIINIKLIIHSHAVCLFCTPCPVFQPQLSAYDATFSANFSTLGALHPRPLQHNTPMVKCGGVGPALHRALQQLMF